MFYWFLTVFVDLKVIDTYRHHGSKWGYKLGIKSVFCHWPNPQKPSESGSNCTNRKGTQTKICQKTLILWINSIQDWFESPDYDSNWFLFQLPYTIFNLKIQIIIW